MAMTKDEMADAVQASTAQLYSVLRAVGAHEPQRSATDALAQLLRHGWDVLLLAAEVQAPRRPSGHPTESGLVLGRLWTYAIGTWQERYESGPPAEMGLRIYVFNLANALMRYHDARIKQDLVTMRYAVLDIHGYEGELAAYLDRQAQEAQSA